MKKWNAAEISALFNSVENADSVSTGIRNFILENPGRSFQACSHIYYKVKKEDMGENGAPAPVEALPLREASNPTATVESEEKISILTYLKNLFKKLFKKS